MEEPESTCRGIHRPCAWGRDTATPPSKGVPSMRDHSLSQVLLPPWTGRTGHSRPGEQSTPEEPVYPTLTEKRSALRQLSSPPAAGSVLPLATRWLPWQTWAGPPLGLPTATRFLLCKGSTSNLLLRNKIHAGRVCRVCFPGVGGGGVLNGQRPFSAPGAAGAARNRHPRVSYCLGDEGGGCRGQGSSPVMCVVLQARHRASWCKRSDTGQSPENAPGCAPVADGT